MGVVVEGAAGAYEIGTAPEGKKLQTTARVGGQIVGGALGYMAGTALVAVALVAAPAAAVMITAVVVGGALAIAGSKLGGWAAEAAYKWFNGD